MFLKCSSFICTRLLCSDHNKNEDTSTFCCPLNSTIYQEGSYFEFQSCAKQSPKSIFSSVSYLDRLVSPNIVVCIKLFFYIYVYYPHVNIDEIHFCTSWLIGIPFFILRLLDIISITKDSMR